jgi:hypothetical protein
VLPLDASVARPASMDGLPLLPLPVVPPADPEAPLVPLVPLAPLRAPASWVPLAEPETPVLAVPAAPLVPPDEPPLVPDDDAPPAPVPEVPPAPVVPDDDVAVPEDEPDPAPDEEPALMLDDEPALAPAAGPAVSGPVAPLVPLEDVPLSPSFPESVLDPQPAGEMPAISAAKAHRAARFPARTIEVPSEARAVFTHMSPCFAPNALALTRATLTRDLAPTAIGDVGFLPHPEKTNEDVRATLANGRAPTAAHAFELSPRYTRYAHHEHDFASAVQRRRLRGKPRHSCGTALFARPANSKLPDRVRSTLHRCTATKAEIATVDCGFGILVVRRPCAAQARSTRRGHAVGGWFRPAQPVV